MTQQAFKSKARYRMFVDVDLPLETETVPVTGSKAMITVGGVEREGVIVSSNTEARKLTLYTEWTHDPLQEMLEG